MSGKYMELFFIGTGIAAQATDEKNDSRGDDLREAGGGLHG